MYVTLKKKIVTSSEAIYDYWVDGDKKKHGIASLNIINNSINPIKLDNKENDRYYFHKAISRIRSMANQGEFLDDTCYAAG